jgi:hypothetical protein
MATQSFIWEQWPSPDGTPCVVSLTYDDVTLKAATISVTKQASYRPTLSVLDEATQTVVFGPSRLPQGASFTQDISTLNYSFFRDSEGNIGWPFQILFS